MTMREKLIENPFPRVRHKKGWKGSPSSNRGISFSSSANHFIINIQEIPRSLPKIPPFLYTLPENEQEKKIKEKKIKEKNNNFKNNLRPLTSNGFRNNSSIKAAQLAAMHNRRRPNTAPVAQDETKWALTKNNSNNNNNNNNNSTDESNGKYSKANAVPQNVVCNYR